MDINSLISSENEYSPAADPQNETGGPHLQKRAALRSFLRNQTAVAFLLLFIFIVLFAFIQPLLPNQKDYRLIYNDPSTGIQYVNRLPDEEFFLGTNSIGQDLWGRMWAGTRVSLAIAFAVVCIDGIIGTVVGLAWGYSRLLSGILTEVYNIFSSIPKTLVLILFSYILKPGAGTIILGLCLTGWLSPARLIRNKLLILKENESILALQSLGLRTSVILRNNILPELTSVIAVDMVLAIPSVIGSEVFVTTIGIGLPPDIPSLGTLIQAGRTVITHPGLRYQMLFPITILILLSFSLYVVGNAIADAADPQKW